jgi:thiaminase (transcriptional activator TenA)
MMRTATQSGRYEQMLAVLVVAEWSYLEWARPDTEKAPNLPFWYGGWFSLHAGDGFEAVVAYLRSQLDHTWEGLSPERRAAVETTFCQTVALEVTFFDAAKRGFG